MGPGVIWVKMTPDDTELLRRYLKDASSDAFEQLVKRHSALVYSAALRQVASPELAQEVAQSVFVKLAQKAGRLSSDVILSGWLYRATWYFATKVARQEQRRQLREQGAVSMNLPADDEDSTWKQIEPHLDDAMETLGETDRAALVLRYLENKSLREVGSALGTNEDAAQKRVARALEKLRTVFTRRQIGVSSAALAGAMSTFGVKAAPVAIHSAILAAATSSAVVGGGGFLTTTIANMMTITNTKIAIAVGVTVAATQFIVHENTERQLQDETESLRAENAQFQGRAAGALAVSDPDLMAEVARLREETAQLREQAAEVHELRGLATFLQRENDKLKSRLGDTAPLDAGGQDETIPSDPMARRQMARQLMKEGRHAAALEHLLWCFDEGVKSNPGFVGVRTSFLLNDLAELGEAFPPAKDALAQRRDAAEEKIREGSDDRMLMLELTRLNGALKEDERTLELFDALPPGNPSRSEFVMAAFDELLDARRYDDIFAAITPEAYFGTQARNFAAIRDTPRYAENEQMQNSALDSLIGAGGKAVETLAGTDQTQRAIDLVNQVLQHDATLETVEDLKRHVRRSGNSEVLRYLDGIYQ